MKRLLGAILVVMGLITVVAGISLGPFIADAKVLLNEPQYMRLASYLLDHKELNPNPHEVLVSWSADYKLFEIYNYQDYSGPKRWNLYSASLRKEFDYVDPDELNEYHLIVDDVLLFWMPVLDGQPAHVAAEELMHNFDPSDYPINEKAVKIALSAKAWWPLRWAKRYSVHHPTGVFYYLFYSIVSRVCAAAVPLIYASPLAGYLLMAALIIAGIALFALGFNKRKSS